MEFLAGYIISASEVINNIKNYNKLMRLKIMTILELEDRVNII